MHGQPWTQAIDAQGNADCIKGQWGYPDGPLTDTAGRYPPVPASGTDVFPTTPGSTPPDQGTYNTWQRAHGGGSHQVVANNPPFLYGPTYTGLKNINRREGSLHFEAHDPPDGAAEDTTAVPASRRSRRVSWRPP